MPFKKKEFEKIKVEKPKVVKEDSVMSKDKVDEGTLVINPTLPTDK